MTNRLNIHDDLTIADLTLIGEVMSGNPVARPIAQVQFASHFLDSAYDADMIELMDALGQNGSPPALALVDKIGNRF